MKKLLLSILVSGLAVAGLFACDEEATDVETTDEVDVETEELEPVDDVDEDEIDDPDHETIVAAKAAAREYGNPTNITAISCESDDDCEADEECTTEFDICLPDDEVVRHQRIVAAEEHDYYTEVVDHAVIHIDGIVSPADEARIEEAVDKLVTVRNVEVVAGDRISVVYDRQRRHYDDIKAVVDSLGYDAGSVTVSPRE